MCPGVHLLLVCSNQTRCFDTCEQLGNHNFMVLLMSEMMIDTVSRLAIQHAPHVENQTS